MHTHIYTLNKVSLVSAYFELGQPDIKKSRNATRHTIN